jgi:hypothetical protein
VRAGISRKYARSSAEGLEAVASISASSTNTAAVGAERGSANGADVWEGRMLEKGRMFEVLYPTQGGFQWYLAKIVEVRERDEQDEVQLSISWENSKIPQDGRRTAFNWTRPAAVKYYATQRVQNTLVLEDRADGKVSKYAASFWPFGHQPWYNSGEYSRMHDFELTADTDRSAEVTEEQDFALKMQLYTGAGCILPGKFDRVNSGIEDQLNLNDVTADACAAWEQRMTAVHACDADTADAIKLQGTTEMQEAPTPSAVLTNCDSGGGSTSGSGQTEQAPGSDAGMESDADNHSSDSNNGSVVLGDSRDGAAEYQGPVCLPRSFIAAVTLNAQLHCWPIGTSTGGRQAIEACGDDYSCTSLNGLAPSCLGRRTALACTVLPCAVSEQRLIRHE